MFLNRLKTRIGTFLLALALVGSGLLTAFHHHESEAQGSEHCATCHLGHQAKVADLVGAGGGEISIPEFFHETLLPALAPKLAVSAFLLGKFSQAPPRA